jgi:DNA-binding transcriptional ArsR family regulator
LSARPSAAPIFAALGDETRLRLISRLCDEGPLSITKLSGGFDVTRQAITKHLYTMADAGLLRSRREGRESLWEVRPERLEDARRSLELISKQWDHSLARLKKLVEE